MSDTSSTRFAGHCYCGDVRFTVDLGEDPLFSAYCHCDSCRRAHAAPLYRALAVDARRFELTQGAELITEYRKPDKGIMRCFCKQCGSKIFNRILSWKPEGKDVLVTFVDLLEEGTQAKLPANASVKRHANPGECVLDWDALLTARPE